MIDKKRIILFFIFVGLFSVSYQIGVLSPVSEDDSSEFLDEFQATIGEIDGFGLFIHNLTIALPMFIPGFGVAWGLFTGWSTGLGFASIVASVPSLSNFPPLAILYFSPFGIMELIAYSLGISRSYLIIYEVLKRRSIKPQLMIIGIEIGIVFALLLAAGYIEFTMIDGAKDLIPNVGDL